MKQALVLQITQSVEDDNVVLRGHESCVQNKRSQYLQEYMYRMYVSHKYMPKIKIFYFTRPKW